MLFFSKWKTSYEKSSHVDTETVQEEEDTVENGRYRFRNSFNSCSFHVVLITPLNVWVLNTNTQHSSRYNNNNDDDDILNVTKLRTLSQVNFRILKHGSQISELFCDDIHSLRFYFFSTTFFFFATTSAILWDKKRFYFFSLLRPGIKCSLILVLCGPKVEWHF